MKFKKGLIYGLTILFLNTGIINVTAEETTNNLQIEDEQNIDFTTGSEDLQAIQEGIETEENSPIAASLNDLNNTTEKVAIDIEKGMRTVQKYNPVLGSELVRKGDIFITSGTSPSASGSGIVGHAGIAISSNEILSINGYGEYPTVRTVYNWLDTYNEKGWTKVYRVNSKKQAEKAADWAKKYYYSSNRKDIEYAIFTTTLNSKTEKTYCSRIVWQAYKYGTNAKIVWDAAEIKKISQNYILPYDLDDVFTYPYSATLINYAPKGADTLK